jgi:hypothetical protein
MTQQTIQVGATPNDGQGTPLRNSFIICNSNFTELYARAQVNPPVTLQGSEGDLAGWYAYDSQYFYYCFADYTDGVDDIWAQVSQVGNVSVSIISNGNSNISIDGINGNAITSIAGVSNIIVANSTGQYVTGIVSATGNIRGSYILGNGSQLTGLPATYTNANVTALLSNFGSNSISSTGNVTSANVNSGSITSTGNVNASQQISATGNITTSGYFLGDFIGNVVATISNLPGPNGAVVYNNGTGNAAGTAGLVFDNSSPNVLTVLGSYSATSNVVAGNVLTGGLISATGNVTGGNLRTGGLISATGGIDSGATMIAQGNISGANLISNGLITATANIVGGNILTAGSISATGNVTGGNLSIGSQINIGGNMSALGYTGTSLSVSGNVSGGNVRTGGLVSATGNVTGAYIFGNGSQLTGLVATNTIQNGNSNVLVGTVDGNVSINVNGIAPLVIVTPAGQTTTGNISATGTVTAGNVDTGGTISATGTIRGGNVLTNGAISATGNIYSGNLVMPSGTGNITSHDITSGGNVIVTGLVSAVGNVIAGNVSTSGNLLVGVIAVNSGNAATAIINSASNGAGNIGSNASTFNTVFAKATTAQYADLAENYVADADYAPGTVVIFGGEKEITISIETADERVAGAISTQPAHLMNAASPGLPVALRGQVPVNVVGPVTKGDSLVTSSTPGFAQSVGRDRSYAQAVFAKSLETNLEDGKKIIVAVIL